MSLDAVSDRLWTIHAGISEKGLVDHVHGVRFGGDLAQKVVES